MTPKARPIVVRLGSSWTPGSGIPSRTTGGGSRLAVLAQDITDELLAQPEEDPEETPPGFDP
jgi:hypothetical protein